MAVLADPVALERRYVGRYVRVADETLGELAEGWCIFVLPAGIMGLAPEMILNDGESVSLSPTVTVAEVPVPSTVEVPTWAAMLGEQRKALDAIRDVLGNPAASGAWERLDAIMAALK